MINIKKSIQSDKEDGASFVRRNYKEVKLQLRKIHDKIEENHKEIEESS